MKLFLNVNGKHARLDVDPDGLLKDIIQTAMQQTGVSGSADDYNCWTDSDKLDASQKVSDQWLKDYSGKKIFHFELEFRTLYLIHKRDPRRIITANNPYSGGYRF